jgi:hypothetical protein
MRLGRDGTQELDDMLDAEQQTWSQQVLTVVTERFERRLLDECSKLRVEMARDRFELVKWMFLFWLGQVAAIAAMLNFMLRK